MTEELFSGPWRSLGTVVGGSLNEGVAVKLDSDISMLINSGIHLRMPGWPMGGTRAI